MEFGLWLLLLALITDAAIIIALIFLYRTFKKRSVEYIESVFFIGIITLVSSLPLLNDFIYNGHDIVFQLQRIENIKVNLLAGQFPVRMNYLADMNVGVPSPAMYPELFLYFPALLRILGIPLVFSVKVFQILINLSCALVSYYAVKQITKSESIGLIFSGLYTLCIYRLENMYLRFAIGEAAAMVFIPLIMLGIYEILYNEHGKWHIFTIGITGLLQSHIILTFLTGCFLIIFIITSIKRFNRERVFALIKSSVCILLLNIWFIIPFITYYNLVDLPGRLDLQDTSVYLHQLFATFVNNAGNDLMARGATNGEMPFSLGGVIGIGLIIFIYMIIVNKRNHNGELEGLEKQGRISLILGLIAAFAASALFPWYDVRPLNLFYFLQFAWRFLGIAAPLLSLAAGIGFYLLFRKIGIVDRVGVLIAICLCIAGSAFYIDSVLQTEAYLAGPAELTDSWTRGDYKYHGSDHGYTLNSGNNVIVSSDSIAISNWKKSDNGRNSISWRNTAKINNAYIEFPIYNFPGYAAIMDGKRELSIQNGTNNFVRVFLPDDVQGGTIRLHYRGLKRFIAGDIISAVTFILFILNILRRKFPAVAVKISRRGRK